MLRLSVIVMPLLWTRSVSVRYAARATFEQAHAMTPDAGLEYVAPEQRNMSIVFLATYMFKNHARSLFSQPAEVPNLLVEDSR